MKTSVGDQLEVSRSIGNMLSMWKETGIVLCALLVTVLGHSYHLGGCPAVEPMSGFDVNRFLGKWYVIQKTSTGSACLINNYTRNAEEPGKYKLEQISEHFLLGLTSYDHKYHYTGDLSIPSQDVPAKMHVKFPLNVAGGATYTVFMTDYDTYAGVFTCQKLAFAHRQSATILSRESTLSKMVTDKIRNKLSSFGVDPYDLSIIKQADCNKESDSTNFNIDGKTFSSESVAGVFRKAGEKIGDGFEYVGDKAKDVYHKVKGDSSREDIKDPNNDAEWLP